MSAKLQSDRYGFLVGTPTEIGNAIKIWSEIRDDVSAIRKEIGKQEAASARMAKTAQRQAANDPSGKVASPRLRANANNIVNASSRSAASTSSSTSARAIRPRSTSQSSSPEAKLVEAVKESTKATNQQAAKASRDAKGRFLRKDGSSPSASSSSSGAGFFSRLRNKFGGSGFSGVAVPQMQDVDPTLMAANELSSILSPLGKVASPLGRGFGQIMSKGYRRMRGGDPSAQNGQDDRSLRVEKKKVSWLDRIYTALTDLRTSEERSAKESQKKLSALGDRTKDGGSQSKGLLGMLGGAIMSMLSPLLAPLLNTLRSVPLLGRLVPSIGGGIGLGAGGIAGEVGATGGMAGGAAGAAKSTSRIGRFARGAGKFLKRVPMLGAILALGGMAFDANAVENDDTLTADQKTDQHVVNASKTAGGLAGALAGGAGGAAIGTAILPVVGTAIGGLIGAFLGSGAGEIIGNLFGGWINDLRKSDVMKSIGKKFDSLTQSMGSIWESAVKAMADAWERISSMASDAWNGTKEKAVEAWDKTVEIASIGIEKVVDGFTETKKFVSENYQAAKKAVTGNETVRATGEYVSEKVDAVSAVIAPYVEQSKELAGKAADAMANTRAGKLATSAGRGLSGVAKSTLNNWNEAKGYLLNAAGIAGVDPSIMAKIGNVESGFNFDAAPVSKNGKLKLFDGRSAISTAHGLGQFIDSSWTGMLNKYGGKYGVEGGGDPSKGIVGKLSKEQAAKYRTDKAVQAGMFAEAAKEEMEIGRKYGGADDAANIYAVHNLGGEDAKKFFKGLRNNPEMSVRDALLDGSIATKRASFVDQIISGNPSIYKDKNGRDVSVAEAYQNQVNLMRRGDKFAEDIKTNPPLSVPNLGLNLPNFTMPSFSSFANQIQSIRIPTVPSVPDAPSYNQLRPFESMKPPTVNVTIDRGEVGQDVQDRGIAHISTGGLSMKW